VQIARQGEVDKVTDDLATELLGGGEVVANAPAERSEFLLRARRHLARDQQPALGPLQITVLYFTAIFLKTIFGLGMQEILILSLAFQVIAIPSTIFFGWLGDRWSQRGTVYVTLLIWIVVLGLMGFAEGEHAPLAIVVTLGLVLGSTQSLLRSMYAQMVPPDQSGEYFGFHALAGRASSALGPLLFGLVSVMAGSQRMAMLSLGLFLLAGAVLLARVQPVSGRE
jgi:UMF1 family MFS transporter